MATLLRHPDTPCDAVTRLSVEIMRAGATMMIFYRVHGVIGDLKLPPAAAPERADELWKHTCFEIFLRRADQAYAEFNFAPSGQWAAYSFDAYRANMQELGV